MTIKKIAFPDDYKRHFTLANLEQCKKLEDSIRNDDGKIDLSWEAAMVAIIGSDSHVCDSHILAARAEFSRNARVWDHYCEGTETMDVWIEAKAFDSCYGFYDVGAYLSDIWQYSCELKEVTKEHMYIKHYVLEK